VLLAVTDAALRFHASAKYDDAVRVRTTLQRVGSRGLTFAYRIERVADGGLLVSAETSLVSVTREGRLTSLPSDVRSWMEQAGGDA
jgi:acyl-CoA thioester hydrolase